MPVFFNGRLWVSPATMSMVNDSKMYNSNLSVGNVLALVGSATGGTPNTALTFGNPADAAAVLRGGDLLNAVQRAFTPSSQSPGPSSITVVRTNPATQSALTLSDSLSNPVITLTSKNYGLLDNQIAVKVEAGSTVGLKLTTMFGTSYASVDNLIRQALTIQYAGTGTALMTVTNTTFNVTLNGVLTSIDLTQFATIQALVTRLSAITGITASVVSGSQNFAALNGLDGATSVDIKTAPVTATGTLQACIDWFNSSANPYVGAARPTNAVNAPALLPYTFLSGGVDGAVTNTQWANAFTVLQSVNAQWVVPLSGDPSVAAMADAHVQFMSNIGRKERRAICGTTLATSDTAAITAALALNSDRTSLVHLGIYDYDANGNLVLFAPYIAAAMIAGAFAGLNPGTPMTNKSISVRGLERTLRNPTDTDALINGGVLCLEATSSGFKVVQSISTWLTNSNFNRREISVGWALDFVMANVRAAVNDLRGGKNNPITLALAVEKAESALRLLALPEPGGPGVIVGDANSPAYKGITASISNDVLAVSFQCSPVLPTNYIPVVCYAVPYSGTASQVAAQ